MSLALTLQEQATVRAVLAAHLPAGAQVQVFGSRAGGSAKPWSDLDLALDADTALPLAVMAALAEAFDESALPFKVDLVDRNAISPAFARIVAATGVTLER